MSSSLLYGGEAAVPVLGFEELPDGTKLTDLLPVV